MIDCISCAIALDHRICRQNWLAEPAGVSKWQSQSLDMPLSHVGLGYQKERHHHLS